MIFYLTPIGPLSGDLHPNVASLNSESRTGRDDDGEGKKDASGDSSISSHKLSSRDRGQISNGGDLSTDDLDSFFNTKPTQLNNLETRFVMYSGALCGSSRVKPDRDINFPHEYSLCYSYYFYKQGARCSEW